MIAADDGNFPYVVSNIVSDYQGNLWVMTADNDTGTTDNDSITFYSRTTGNNWVDNGTFATTLNFASIGYPTIAKLSSAGTKLYGAFGTGTAVYPKLLYVDNGTTDNVTSSVTVGVADTWCHAALDGYGIIVGDNGSTGGNAGPTITKHFDNGTLSAVTMAGIFAQGSSTNGLTDLDATSPCAITTDGSSNVFLALADDTGGTDNISVYHSTDLATWTQIGSDIDTGADTLKGLAIEQVGTSSSTAADNDLWVAANVGGTVYLYHYEDLAGGSSPAWRSVATMHTNAGSSVPSIASDNSSIIAVGAGASNEATVRFWYNQ